MLVSYSRKFVAEKVLEILDGYLPTLLEPGSLQPRLRLSASTRPDAPVTFMRDAGAAASAHAAPAPQYGTLESIAHFRRTKLYQGLQESKLLEEHEVLKIYALLYAPKEEKKDGVPKSDSLDDIVCDVRRDGGHRALSGMTFGTRQVYAGSYVFVKLLWVITCVVHRIIDNEEVFINLLTLTHELRFLLFLKSNTESFISIPHPNDRVSIDALRRIRPDLVNEQKFQFFFSLASQQVVAPSTLVLCLYSFTCDTLKAPDSDDSRRNFMGSIYAAADLRDVIFTQKNGQLGVTYTDAGYKTTFGMHPKSYAMALENPNIPDQFRAYAFHRALLPSSQGAAASASVWLSPALENAWNSITDALNQSNAICSSLNRFITSQPKKGVLASLAQKITQSINQTAYAMITLRLYEVGTTVKEPVVQMLCLLIDLWSEISGLPLVDFNLATDSPPNRFLERLVRCLDEDSSARSANRTNRNTIYELFSHNPSDSTNMKKIFISWSFCFAVLVPRWNENKYAMFKTLISDADMDTLINYLDDGRLHQPGGFSGLSWLPNFNPYIKVCCLKFTEYHSVMSEISVAESKRADTTILTARKNQLEAEMGLYNVATLFQTGGFTQLALTAGATQRQLTSQ
jgi:hypothetical protein